LILEVVMGLFNVVHVRKIAVEIEDQHHAFPAVVVLGEEASSDSYSLFVT
jgi:hypothetical protein